MKIKKITIKNFKFHQNLEPIEINKQNCLIYGENGSGKSSIYWALYSVFKIYLRNNNFDFQKFKNINIDDLGVEVKIDNNLLKIPNRDYSLPENISLENCDTVYFANQDLLNNIIDSNIFLYLRKYFRTLDSIYRRYENIQSTLTAQNHIDKIKESKLIDAEFEKKLNQIELRANDIIQNHFEDTFELNISMETIGINSNGLSDDLEFQNPKIEILIDTKKNLKLYFNEAKLKLASLAIFFALIKVEEDEENTLKLLVLDDFLTSLDMGHRHYIIEYIFNNFQDYQIILLTHNLQFYNLILDWLNTHNKDNEWDIKNIYIRYNENREESIIYSKNVDYISEAERKLSNGEFQNAGNLIRKEFELLIHEFEKLYRLGKREESDTILSLILNDKPIYFKQNQLLESISRDINHCKNMSNDIERNKDRIKEKLEKISNEIQENSSVSNEHLKSILEKLIFYRKIVLNRASHNNPDIEIYQREYRNSLRVIKKLKILLDELK